MDIMEQITTIANDGARPHIKTGIMVRLQRIADELQGKGPRQIDLLVLSDRLETEIARLGNMP